MIIREIAETKIRAMNTGKNPYEMGRELFQSCIKIKNDLEISFYECDIPVCEATYGVGTEKDGGFLQGESVDFHAQ